MTSRITTSVRTGLLTFLGTRGGIRARSRLHRRHSALLLEYHDARIMIDCGSDWRHRLRKLAPTAIVLTHAHPDHAGGLADGAPCPVFATKITAALLHRFPIVNWHVMPTGKETIIGGVRFQALRVQHSVRAPAVAYRISIGSVSFLYAPDIARFMNRKRAFYGVKLFIGDGAVLKRSLIRKRRRHLIGHASVTHQLDWCKSAGIIRAIFTHCGTGIVRGVPREVDEIVCRLGCVRGIQATLARDGQHLRIGSHLIGPAERAGISRRHQGGSHAAIRH